MFSDLIQFNNQWVILIDFQSQILGLIHSSEIFVVLHHHHHLSHTGGDIRVDDGWRVSKSLGDSDFLDYGLHFIFAPETERGDILISDSIIIRIWLFIFYFEVLLDLFEFVFDIDEFEVLVLVDIFEDHFIEVHVEDNDWDILSDEGFVVG